MPPAKTAGTIRKARPRCHRPVSRVVFIAAKPGTDAMPSAAVRLLAGWRLAADPLTASSAGAAPRPRVDQVAQVANRCILLRNGLPLRRNDTLALGPMRKIGV